MENYQDIQNRQEEQARERNEKLFRYVGNFEKFGKASQQLLDLGFDLDRNSTRDFLECVKYLIVEDEENEG